MSVFRRPEDGRNLDRLLSAVTCWKPRLAFCGLQLKTNSAAGRRSRETETDVIQSADREIQTAN